MINSNPNVTYSSLCIRKYIYVTDLLPNDVAMFLMYSVNSSDSRDRFICRFFLLFHLSTTCSKQYLTLPICVLVDLSILSKPN